ncbi:type II toxin-antitoxin system VapB family antitoxin [Cupriavidus sp. SZY C1]|uniref:antitoxin n=1 Tax=Cupriavidus sp. SZY C1 TaxID=3055037 RepID=UPI0028B3FDA5|nr:type II toxin-antitoxin system VapB family antitoxin [Cupriavidus sp. SZY C1]MDT6961797.1 type II toxin-antitoxin system VapB family antitoxin [Cupriavidus sp. SZY C1]
MHRTKLFRNGNSQAIRIPADLAYPDTDIPFEIERVGDELRIRPARRRLTGLLNVFASFPADFMAEGREEQSQSERDPL